MRRCLYILASCAVFACSGDDATSELDATIADMTEVDTSAVEAPVGAACGNLDGRPEWPTYANLWVGNLGGEQAQFIWWNGPGSGYDLEGWMLEDEIVAFGLFPIKACEPVATVTIPMWTFIRSDLEPDTHYRFRVEALDQAGRWSTDGPEVVFKTECATFWEDFCPPTWPEGAVMTARRVGPVGDGTLELTWTAAYDNQDEIWYRLFLDGAIVDPQGGVAITEYTVQRRNTYRVSGLVPGEQYRFEVVVRDNMGSSGINWVTGPTLDIQFGAD